VFPVNLVQIRSAVPKIFHTQTKKLQTAENRTLRSELRMLMKVSFKWVVQILV